MQNVWGYDYSQTEEKKEIKVYLYYNVYFPDIFVAFVIAISAKKLTKVRVYILYYKWSLWGIQHYSTYELFNCFATAWKVAVFLFSFHKIENCFDDLWLLLCRYYQLFNHFLSAIYTIFTDFQNPEAIILVSYNSTEVFSRFQMIYTDRIITL